MMDNGRFMRGPFTFVARQMILDRLLELQKAVGRELISAAEVSLCKRIWAEDICAQIKRHAEGPADIKRPKQLKVIEE